MQRLLLLPFAIWVRGEYWQKFAEAALKVRDFATVCLADLHKHLGDSLKDLDSFDSAKLHAMLIQAKKLRYSAEFFVLLCGRHKSEKYLAAISKLQEVLG